MYECEKLNGFTPNVVADIRSYFSRIQIQHFKKLTI